MKGWLKHWDETKRLTREEAIKILNLPKEDVDDLIACAYALRTKYKGKKVSVQLLTNVRSGNCSQNCAYCAQSCESHAAIEKYRRVSDEKLYGDNDLVDDKHLARHCIGLSGIQFSDAEIEDLAERIREMKKKGTQICCSIGFLTEKQARLLKDAGLDRINHNLKSSRRFYPEICTTHTYEQRVANIHMLQDIGFEICSGGIIGMGESMEDRIDLALMLRELGIKSIPINILNPIPGTPLEGTARLEDEEILTTIALFRFIQPDAYLRFAGGRMLISHLETEAIQAGINAAIVGDLLTTLGSKVKEDMEKVKALGFETEGKSKNLKI